MFSLSRTLSLGYLAQHPTRAVLVILSIALGVATLLATQAVSRGLGKAAQESANPLAGLADLLITNGQAGVPVDLADRLDDEIKKGAFPGVAARESGKEASVQPFIVLPVALKELDNQQVKLLALDWSRGPRAGKSGGPAGATVRVTFKDKGERAPDLKALGELLGNPQVNQFLGVALKVLSPQQAKRLLAVANALGNPQAKQILECPPVLLSDDLARELKTKKVDGLTVRAFGRRQGANLRYTPLGTISFDQEKVPFKEKLVILDLAFAVPLAYPDCPDRVQQVGIKLEPGADRAQVRQALEHWLAREGVQADVQTVETNLGLISDVTAGLQLGFAIGGAGALVVGLFLVYNALSVSVAERRHDIGILRSVGATRTQVAGLFISEASGLGLVGSLLGVPLGYLIAWVSVRPLARVFSEAFLQVEHVEVNYSPRLILAALVSGTLVAVLAALVPALQAAGEEPADAVRRVPRVHGAIFYVLQVGACLTLLLGGFLVVGLRQSLPPRSGPYVGIACLLLGSLLATPIAAGFLSRVVQPLFRYLLGLEGRLAADNLVRSPGRTGLVIAALAATGGLMVQTAGFLRSTERALHQWVEEKVAADLFFTYGAEVTSGGFSLPMEEGLADDLRKVDGVDAVLPVRYQRIDLPEKGPDGGAPELPGGHIVLLLAIDARAFDGAEDRSKPVARMMANPRFRERGKVMVSENFAALHRVKVGDRFTIPGRSGPLSLEVIGTVVDYSWNRGTIVVDRDWFKEEFVDTQVDILEVFLKPGADRQAVAEELRRRWPKEKVFFVQTRPEAQQKLRSQLRRVYGMAYAQQTIVGLVALLGVMSALFISVLQRRRELGLLRAVGATRAQIMRSVLAEAVLMGLIGATVGFFIGLLLEWYVLDVILLDESGLTFPMRIAWLESGAVGLLAIVAATLAGLWPAYHATRLRIPEAIAYE
jgi:putative ABC transport system permease protein